MNLNKYKLLAGDASFRKFYRSSRNSIIVFSKKKKYLNLLVYDAINNCLIKNGINAPKLKKEFYNRNYIEIEDLGNKSIFKILKKEKNRTKIYLNIIKILKSIQKIRTKNLATFKKVKYKIPQYTKAKILNEANLFLEWYLPKVIKKVKAKKAKIEIKRTFDNILKKLKLDKKEFVHKDFHVSNMMYHKKKIYIIDSQDAVYGNITYDLASLIDDVRLKTSEEFKNKIFNKFIKLNSTINKEKLKNDFEILSVLRNLKIIGIFTRLAVRDKKKKYMKMIPYAWKMIEYRISKNLIFKDLELKLNKYFSKKLRKKKMEINTALILCAGYGKRLNPITLSKPKPLIEINKTTLLQNTLNLIESLNIKNILINSFYLSEKIEKYVANLNINLKVIKDGEKILDTGGGILNLINNCKQSDFLVFNPDTIWNEKYTVEIQNMKKFYFENNVRNILLVAEKSKSFDQRMNGDFFLKNNILNKSFDKNCIFTGCQILNKSVFENYKVETFSMNQIWDEMISKNQLYGCKSEGKFTHLTDIEIYNKLTKI